VEAHHWEVYLFGAGQSLHGERSGLAPAMEANYGPFEDAQLQFQIPMAYARGEEGQSRHGFGDVQAGFKYRFLQETGVLPQLAIYPQVQAPTGRSGEGLGAGHWRILIPLWAQKSFGEWTTFGGGGWWRNPGVGNHDYTIWGWQVQRAFGEGRSLGVEIFHQGAPSEDEPATTCWDLGFECPIAPHLQLVGSAGRFFQGGRGSVFYVGIRGKV
jgi:hypothetical protein